MKKTNIKKAVDTLYARLGERFDMKKYELVELHLKTCITPEEELFTQVEARITTPDTEEKDYAITFDL